MNVGERIRKFEGYRKAVLLTLPITTALLIFLVMIGAQELFLSEWFISLISIPNFVAFQLGTAAYFGGLRDNYKLYKKDGSRKREIIGTFLGLLIGIGVAVWLIAIQYAIPFAATLFAAASILYMVRQINTFAGLGNRIGRMLDPNSRPMIEKIIVGAGISLALITGIALVATAAAGLVGIAGITTFISAGGAIPVWLASILFVVTLSSNIGSTVDYLAKSINFLRVKYFNASQNDKEFLWDKNFILNSRFHEYRGSLVGVSAGVICGSIAVAALVLTQPYLFVGVAGVVTAALVITTAASVFGSICSRIGRFWDPLRNVNNSAEAKAQRDPAHEPLLENYDTQPTPKPTPRPANERRFNGNHVPHPRQLFAFFQQKPAPQKPEPALDQQRVPTPR